MANSIQEIAAVSNLPLQEQNLDLLPIRRQIAKHKVRGSDGYYFIKIEAEVEELSKNRVNLIYSIEQVCVLWPRQTAR